MTEFLDREAPPQGASVYVHDTAGSAWDMLLRDGRLRKDIHGVWSIAGADFGLYHHEKHMLGQEYQNWVAFGTVRPAYIGGLDGVPGDPGVRDRENRPAAPPLKGGSAPQKRVRRSAARRAAPSTRVGAKLTSTSPSTSKVGRMGLGVSFFSASSAAGSAFTSSSL